MPRIISIVFIVATLVGCSITPENDYESFDEAWFKTNQQFRGLHNAPHQGLMFLYYGPWAWSDPDWRITVNFNRNHKVEVIRFETHPGFQAGELYDRGIRNQGEMLRHLRYSRTIADGSSCPRIVTITQRIWSIVTEKASAFATNEEQLLMTDGGATFNVWLTNGRYQTVAYSTAYEDDEVVTAVKELEQYVVECGDLAPDNV